MKIQFCSDLHQEMGANEKWLEAHPIIPVADYLVVAGDTHHLLDGLRNIPLLSRLAEQFKQVFILPGNHEYYARHDAGTSIRPTLFPLRPNVFLVNNVSIQLEDVTLIFSILWSRIRHHESEISRGLYDFYVVRARGSRMTVRAWNHFHDRCCKFIETEARKPGKKVVVTHHAPSPLCIAREFIGSPLNDAFHADMGPLIGTSDIDCWIYGHSHRNIGDVVINGTTLASNQLGYVALNEHRLFRRDRYVEV